ncbi:MAG TPA: DUF5018 domain-containing protein [Gillisia sp.]|nr:DUF5018 domain-containing protein [Gillisia sp.]
MKKITIIFLALLVISCSKDDKPVVLATGNQILEFSLSIDGEIYLGIIDQQQKTISFETERKDVSSLKPTIIFSEKARIEPSPNMSRDFRQEVDYTVYAENGVPNVYRVRVNNRPVSLENEIDSFSFNIEGTSYDAVINRQTGFIRADVPLGDISALTPVINIPAHATIDPPANEARDFSIPVTYTVTAENGDRRSYTVQINEPEIEGIILGYSANPSFYVGAEAGLTGRFLLNEGEIPEVYFYDGTNKYVPEQLEFHNSYGDFWEGVRHYAVTFVIPDDIPTNVYTVVMEKRGYRVEYNGLDIKKENAPNPLSLSKEVFSRDDVLKIFGENLTARIVIPSNGSHYLLWETYAVDITVNNERTEMNFTPNYRQDNLYPAYYGREQEERKITFFDESGRIGRSIMTIFK